MTPDEMKVKIIQLEKELDKAIDENIDLNKKLLTAPYGGIKKSDEINYKEKYLSLKNKMKLVIYDE
tara:strand:- start:620 stop:817 length:198 start_codon:yes stop_codon:yes gene_type:complete